MFRRIMRTLLPLVLVPLAAVACDDGDPIGSSFA